MQHEGGASPLDRSGRGSVPLEGTADEVDDFEDSFEGLLGIPDLVVVERHDVLVPVEGEFAVPTESLRYPLDALDLFRVEKSPLDGGLSEQPRDVVSPRIRPTPRHAEVAADLLPRSPFLAGKILHDAHTVVLMREHGVRRIRTLDADFHRFPFVEVVDPVTG